MSDLRRNKLEINIYKYFFDNQGKTEIIRIKIEKDLIQPPY